jgi:GTP cyclohydrolase FolE2
MTSFKTIKIDDDNKVIFKFYNDVFTVDIYLTNSYVHMSKNHNEFNNVINELKSNLNLTNHKIKLVKFWYHKNYKKNFSSVTYVTKYGRVIKPDHTHHTES